VINLREDNLESIYILVTFPYHGNEKIRHIIDNSSISGMLVSAAMSYVIRDKCYVKPAKAKPTQMGWAEGRDSSSAFNLYTLQS
jgi:hypothetical protein